MAHPRRWRPATPSPPAATPVPPPCVSRSDFPVVTSRDGTGFARWPRVTRTPFDQFAKALVIARESPFGDIVSEQEIDGDALYADLAITPDRARLPRRPRDALDRMARIASLWEFYHQAPSFEGLLGCVHKLLGWQHARATKARAAGLRAPPRAVLWVVSAGLPRAVLRLERFTRMKGWPRGFYAGPLAGCVRLVVVSELPRTRATLLLRLMGAGRTLRDAIDDLSALPREAPERILALPHLERLRIAPPATEESLVNRKQFLKATEQLHLQYVDTIRQEGITQGIERGITQGIERGIAPLASLFSRRLGRGLTTDEHRTLAARLDTLGPARLGDVVLDLDAPALDAWLRDPDAL